MIFFDSGNASIPQDQELSITHSICPTDERFDECYVIASKGTAYDDIILLKEIGLGAFKGKLRKEPETKVIALWKDKVGLVFDVRRLLIIINPLIMIMYAVNLIK